MVKSTVCFYLMKQHHPNSSTIKKQSRKKVKKIIKRNKIIIHYLHLSSLELVYFLFINSAKSILRLIAGESTYFKASFSFVGMITQVSCERRKYRAYAISYKEACDYILNDIEKKEIRIF